MTMELLPQFYDHKATATCGDCGHEQAANSCPPIKDPGERLCAGDPLPAGECSECGSLSYVERGDEIHIAEFETRHITIRGYGRSERSARLAVARGWRSHCEQVRGPKSMIGTLDQKEGVNVRSCKFGNAYRDGIDYNGLLT